MMIIIISMTTMKITTIMTHDNDNVDNKMLTITVISMMTA